MKSFTSGWTVIKEISISSSPSRIFNALTDPGHLDKWFTHGARVDLRVGGKYSNLDKDKGRFLDIAPYERLRFTWENPSHAPGSLVEVLMKRVRYRTIVTMILSGFKKKRDFEHYASKESGWNWALQNLKTYLENHKIVEYEEWLKRLNR